MLNDLNKFLTIAFSLDGKGQYKIQLLNSATREVIVELYSNKLMKIGELIKIYKRELTAKN